MEESDEISVETILGLFPKESFSIDPQKTTDSLLVLRSTLKSEEEAENVVKKLSAETHTTWIRYNHNKNLQRWIYHKTWKCHHSSFKKQGASKRNTGCPAILSILIKKITPHTKKKDKLLRCDPPFCTEIRLSITHNHPLNSATALKMHRVPEQVKEQFYSYFSDGLRPSEAASLHEDHLLCKNEFESLANASINPTLNQVIYMHRKWRTDIYGKYHNPFEKLKEKVNISEERGELMDSNTEAVKKKAKGHRCYFCGKKFPEISVLKKHITTHKDRPYTCEICDRKFADKGVLQKHRFVHTKEPRCLCEICGKPFYHSWDLKKHREKHAEKPIEVEGSKACLICGKKYSSTNPLCSTCFLKGKKIVDNGKLCNISTVNSEQSLNEHKTEHGSSETKQNEKLDKQLRFKCSVCGKLFKFLSSLKEHVYHHSLDRPFCCNVCSTKFQSPLTLKKHMYIHINHRPFKCETCDCSYKSAFELKQHSLTHKETRPFTCDICKKGFKLACSLKKHMISHQTARPYTCSTCKRTFKSSYSLKQHTVTHGSERPFKCTICLKGFKFSYHYNRHQRIHTGECPYECVICKKSYKQLNSLRLHLQMHAEEVKSPADTE